MDATIQKYKENVDVIQHFASLMPPFCHKTFNIGYI